MSEKIKYYFHPKLFLGFLLCGTLSVLVFYALADKYSFFRRSTTDIIIACGALALLVPGTIVCLYGLWKQRHRERLPENRFEAVTIEFKYSRILFPDGYYFRQSPLHRSRVISAGDITEVNLHTIPPSLVIQHQEVIFLKSTVEEELKAFSERNGLPLAGRYDIWSAINEPFLDTELSYSFRKNILSNLKENGISVKELRRIRKKIGFTMFSGNYIVQDWLYLGQFDYLSWTWLTDKKYWWSMEVALLNYKRA